MRKQILSGMACAAALVAAAPASAQDYFVGQIILVGNNSCPKYSVAANGQLLPINSNQALFSLYGVTYGGDGRTNFALPDLRGRAAIDWGQGPGLSAYAQGQRSGQETVTLTVNNLPAHTHAAKMHGYNAAPDTNTPASAGFADFPPALPIYNNAVAPDTALANNTVLMQNQGAGMPYPLHSPYLVLRYCVMTQGIYPSRS